MRGPEWYVGLWITLAVFGAGFCAGVGWSAYRAVGWVERMRKWAREVDA